MKKFIFALLLSLVTICKGYGQDLTPPFSVVTSDYGPRDLQGQHGTWFHPGIDYGAVEGSIINAVEGGTISALNWSDEGGWTITVEGAHGIWGYCHMFRGCKDNHPLPQTYGNIELRNATLVNPDDVNDIVNSTVIIFGTGTAGNAAKVITSRRDQWFVRNPDGSYIKNQSGLVNIRTWNTVSATTGFDIGSTGNSGGDSTSPYPFHFHIGLDQRQNNPLLYISRPGVGNYSLVFTVPSDADDGVLDGRIVVSNESGRIPALQVNTITRPSLDFDKIKFYLDQINDQHVIDSFSYGGRLGENRTPNIVNLMSVQSPISGVLPIAGGPGEDVFRHMPWNILHLPNGQLITNGLHTIYCEAYDIRDSMAKRTAIDVIIDNALTTAAIDPLPNATDVPVSTTQKGPVELNIGSNKPIDHATVTPGLITFNPSLMGGFNIAWPNDTLLALTLTDASHDLQYDTKYKVTLSDLIEDTSGNRLDGDGDGQPGGNYVYQFTTCKPKFTFPQRLSFLAKGQSDSFKTQLNNKEKRKLKYRLIYPGSLDGSNGKWKYHLLYFQQMAPDTSYRDIYVDSLGTDTTTIVKITNHNQIKE